MFNMFKPAFIFACILFLFPQILCGQNTTPRFIVDSVDVSYKIVNNNKIPLVVGEHILLQDSINVRSENHFNGHLRLKSLDGNEYNISSPTGPCTLKYALSGKLLSNFKKRLAGLRKGLIDPVEVVIEALGHLWGEENNTSEGLSVAFLCDGKVFPSFESIPVEAPFSICLTNTSNSILAYSLIFQYRRSDTMPYQSIIVDTQKDSLPIILVPGESVVLPSDIIRPRGYLDYSLNIFGGSDFFLLQLAPDSPKTVHVVSDTNNISVNRFYFETNE